MKMVIAYIQSFMAPEVIDALHALPELTGATIIKAQGFGRGRAKGNRAATEGEFIGTRPKVRVEVFVPDALLKQVVAAIAEAAHTGNPGDGKICVMPIDHVLRIRTGEEDEQAI
jgi:nitrogen regulatory protein PII